MSATPSPRATIGVLSAWRVLARDFVLDHVEMLDDVDMQVRFTVDDEALTDLHRLAFGSSATAVQPWAHRLERHSLTWIGAFVGRTLVGFVQGLLGRRLARLRTGHHRPSRPPAAWDWP